MNLSLRVLLALFLIAVVLVGSNLFLAPPEPVEDADDIPAESEPVQPGAPRPEPATLPAPEDSGTSDPIEAVAADVEPLADEAGGEEIVTVEPDQHRVGTASPVGRPGS